MPTRTVEAAISRSAIGHDPKQTGGCVTDSRSAVPGFAGGLGSLCWRRTLTSHDSDTVLHERDWVYSAGWRGRQYHDIIRRAMQASGSPRPNGVALSHEGVFAVSKGFISPGIKLASAVCSDNGHYGLS